MRKICTYIKEPCCYHITHRCQERRFMFKFNLDRQNYLNRLREMKKKYKVDILNFTITSNHIHLFLYSDKASNVASAMHFLQSVTAKDYNKRVKREGAFWRGRYHPTLIQQGKHIANCLFYIDFNMLRAGVARHPFDWKYGGSVEIAGMRKRYTVINIERLMDCLCFDVRNYKGFRQWYTETINEMTDRHYHVRRPEWTESLAVGSKDWIENISHGLMNTKIRKMEGRALEPTISENHEIYYVTGSTNSAREFWKRQQNIP